MSESIALLSEPSAQAEVGKDSLKRAVKAPTPPRRPLLVAKRPLSPLRASTSEPAIATEQKIVEVNEVARNDVARKPPTMPTRSARPAVVGSSASNIMKRSATIEPQITNTFIDPAAANSNAQKQLMTTQPPPLPARPVKSTQLNTLPPSALKRRASASQNVNSHTREAVSSVSSTRSPSPSRAMTAVANEFANISIDDIHQAFNTASSEPVPMTTMTNVDGFPERYHQLFHSLMQQQAMVMGMHRKEDVELLDGARIVEVWSKSLLEKQILHDIWKVVDVESKGALTETEFCIGIATIDEKLAAAARN